MKPNALRSIFQLVMPMKRVLGALVLAVVIPVCASSHAQVATWVPKEDFWETSYRGNGLRGEKWDAPALEGLRRFQRNEYPEAGRAFEQAIAAGCPCPTVLFCLGCTRADAGKSDEAAQWFTKAEQAAANRPNLQFVRAMSFRMLGLLKEREGELEQALAFYRKGAAVQVSEEDSHVFTIPADYEASYVESALEIVGASAEGKAWGKLLRIAAPLYVKSANEPGRENHWRELRDILGKAIAAGCKDDYVFAVYGIACYETEDWDEARKNLLRGEHLPPDHPVRSRALESLGDISFADKNYAEALRCYRAAMESDQAGGDFLRPKVQEAEKQITAQRDLQNAKKQLLGGTPDAGKLLKLARECVKAGNAAEGVRYSAQALRLAPEQPSVHAEHLAILLAAKQFVPLEQAAPAAVDAALKAKDVEALASAMDCYSRGVVEDRLAFEGQPERLRKLEPDKLARRAMDAYPGDPRLVLAYLRIFTEVTDLDTDDNVLDTLLRYVPAAVSQACAQKRWKVACEIALKICCERLYAFSFQDYKQMGMDETTAAAGIQNVLTHLSPAMFDKVADAAVQLESEEQLAKAYEAKLWLATLDIKSVDLDMLERTMADFRKRFPPPKAGDFSFDETSEVNSPICLDDAEEGVAGTLFATGEPRLQAEAVRIIKRFRPDASIKEIELNLAEIAAFFDYDVAKRVYDKYGVAPPDRQQIEYSAPQPPVDWEAEYPERVDKLKMAKKQLLAMNDDASKRGAWSMARRWDVDELISAALQTKRLSEAIEEAEWFQGYALRDLLGTQLDAGMNARLGQQNEEVARQEKEVAALTQRQAKDASGGAAEPSILRDLAVQQKELTQLTAARGALGEEFQSTRTVNALRIEQIQALLDPQTTVVFYHLGCYLGYPPVYGFVAVITREGFQVHVSDELIFTSGSSYVVKDRELHAAPERAQRLLKAIQDCGKGGFGKTQSAEFNEASQWLYDLLVAPVRPHLKTGRLVIVPCDVLFRVPFQLLRGPNGRYLGEEFEISYAPSATVLSFCLRKHTPLGEHALVLANPALDDPSLTLKFSEGEARAIRAVFPQARCYTGAEATENALREGIGAADIVHLACHNLFDARDPMASFLALARDEKHDGKLTAAEVMGLRTSAQLVTLSACETGRSELAEARQDAVGMIRAWMFAGAPTVVASLWKLDDRSTSELMGEFYKNLKTMGRAEALQRAQIAMMKKYENPYYWGAFVLYGDYR